MRACYAVGAIPLTLFGALTVPRRLYAPRKPKPEKPSAEMLAPIPADILGQIVREGPLTTAEVETATRRFKKALIERALGGVSGFLCVRRDPVFSLSALLTNE